MLECILQTELPGLMLNNKDEILDTLEAIANDQGKQAVGFSHFKNRLFMLVTHLKSTKVGSKEEEGEETLINEIKKKNNNNNKQKTREGNRFFFLSSKQK